jgi:hypothetical protein
MAPLPPQGFPKVFYDALARRPVGQAASDLRPAPPGFRAIEAVDARGNLVSRMLVPSTGGAR